MADSMQTFQERLALEFVGFRGAREIIAEVQADTLIEQPEADAAEYGAWISGYLAAMGHLLKYVDKAIAEHAPEELKAVWAMDQAVLAEQFKQHERAERQAAKEAERKAAYEKQRAAIIANAERHGGDVCDRCGGAGGWSGWPGFTCYKCHGEGWTPKRVPKTVYGRMAAR